uniref:Mitogen-activated protein kinase kinase kinase 19 n=1 Tax=Seriola dumerili TaxID=41447 RepID=A0A3B4U701_SERDU
MTDKKMLKALNPARSKERRTRMNCELRANNQTNKPNSFNPLTHKDHSILSRNKSKNNLKYSSLSSQVKDKTRKSPELIISGEATVCKAKSKLKSAKNCHRSTDTPSPRKVIDHPQSKRPNMNKSNNNRAQPPVRELKSARQLKRLSVTGTPRSKSALDFITYKDMFQQIQSTDEGPVISTVSAGLLGSGLAVDDTITWTKGEVLGRGAYGTVYCGLTSQGQLIAVKQVSLDTSDPDTAKREYSRLQGEVELLKTLRHTNIVGFLGTSLYQHIVSIFMEYIPGGSIATLGMTLLALYTHQILEGVAYLHLNRVIHRDLKGNNVMLMPTGIIKLIDFGCARRLSCLNHTASNNGDLLKSVHGTPYWMAPEVINETGYGRKSDIWSVGCTVFEMATGKPPLAHMDKMAALFYIGAQRGLMPSLPNGFSDNAKDFVKICLTGERGGSGRSKRHPFHADQPRGTP